MRLGKTYAAGAAALGITAVLASAAPALAAAGKNSPLLSTSRGNARFYANGDKVIVCDGKTDGYQPIARADYAVTGGGYQEFADVRAPSSTADDFCRSFSKNIPEGRKVYIHLEFWNPKTNEFIDGPSGYGVS